MKYFKNDLPAVDTGSPIIKEKEDLSKIKNINFTDNNRCRFVLDLIDLYKENIGGDFKPRFCAPFSLAVNIRGFNNLINDIYSDRKFVKELFKVINYEVLAPWISMQRKKLGDSSIIASGADAWVTIPNVNLMIMEDIIIPSYLELKDLIGNIYLSIMGGARYLEDVTKFLDLQKVLNPFLVKGFDPDTEMLGPEVFRDYACQNNMDLLLGIDPNFILNFDLEEIIKRIRRYIDVGLSSDGKFTLYFNDIPANISPDKLKKIFDGVREIREGNNK
jgi:uroporphyrinogen-III decarboxylase